MSNNQKEKYKVPVVCVFQVESGDVVCLSEPVFNGFGDEEAW